MNHLYYGDNLEVLRSEIADESIDLIYLDPPFNSQATYNVLFRSPAGERSRAQIEAFEDAWHWTDEAEKAFDEVMTSGNADAAEMLRAMRSFLKENDMMAYLTMMAVRLLELHRVLKQTGSFYLHCDPTAGHYLKTLLDAVFGPDKFRTEIVWKRSSAHSDTKQGRRQHGRVHDLIFFYTKGEAWTWNPIYTPYDQDYRDAFYKHIEPETGRLYRLGDLTGPGGAAKGNPRYEVMGVARYWRYSQEKMEELIRQGRIVQTMPGAVPAYKRYLDEMPGVPLQDIWTDIGPIGAQAQERLGYPTQKPLALLERIIQAGSNEGDIVLDPFCGCGTTIHAAQKLNRTTEDWHTV
jgi:adenine specific DNA methylase Mod